MRTEITNSTVTPDGWTLTLSVTQISIKPVPNISGNAFTKEGFVSATAVASLSKTTTAQDEETRHAERLTLPPRSIGMHAETSCQLNFPDKSKKSPDSDNAFENQLNPLYVDSPLGTLNPTQPDELNVGINPTITLNQQTSAKAKPGGLEQRVLLTTIISTPTMEELAHLKRMQRYLSRPLSDTEHMSPEDKAAKFELNVKEIRDFDRLNGEQAMAKKNAIDRAAARADRTADRDPMVSVRNQLVRRERCAGAVFVRIHAEARVNASSRSDQANNGEQAIVEVYGDPVQL